MRIAEERQWRAPLMLAVSLGVAVAAAGFGRATGSARPRVAAVAATKAGSDLSGVWSQQNAITLSATEPPMQPWAEAAYKAAKPGYGPRATPDSQDPILSCLPPGVPRIMLIPFPMQISEIPGQVLMIFEYDHYIRQIYTNRREHLKDLNPSWMGDSIGHWEGGTLVVDTVGFNDKSWLDQVGHPHSEALHVVERLRRLDHDTLVDDVSIDDPKAYTKPWGGQLIYKLRPGWHLIEYICEDNKGFRER